MRFRSPTEHPVQLSLTSGHTFVIGPDLVEVPQRFHKMAVMEGCIPEGFTEAPQDEPQPNTKHALIVAGIKKMLADPKDGDFNNDGRPDVRRLSAVVGFTVLAGERDAAWQDVNDDE